VIPAPLSAVQTPGVFTIRDGATVSYADGDAEARFAAEHFVDLLERTRGLRVVAKGIPAGAPSTASIALTRTASAASIQPDESYDLSVSPKQAAISASGDAGLYYGTVTLWGC
jgi:hexosaminidase